MNKRKKNLNNGFTLVELIVVIVILAILATIAFLSFSSQSASARDSTRLSDMSNISKGLSVFNATSGVLPMPENKLEIWASGTTIGYQGYAGASILNMIKISNGGKDPLDTNTYYTYAANANLSKFQILGFLEDSSNISLSLMPFTKNMANAEPSSYSGRYAISKGDVLGILLQSGSLVPLQASYVAGSFTGVDVVKTNVTYATFTQKSIILIGTGTVLKIMTSASTNTGAVYSASCKEIFDAGMSKGDGKYFINPTGTASFEAQCDMTSNGGGWTLFARNPGSGIDSYGIDDQGNSSSTRYSMNCNKWQNVATESRINMGTNIDYYKPVTGSGFCAMLGSRTLHMWKGGPTNVLNWTAPKYYGGHLGGSALNWPLTYVPSEQRLYLPFWAGGGSNGGCCHVTANDPGAWGMPFTFWFR